MKMPGIQDIYSVDVSNRYAIDTLENPDEESDSAADYDPLDTLKSLEDQKKRALDEAKKKKQALAITKAKNQKKGSRFQELKEPNVPSKKEGHLKSAKAPRNKEEQIETQPPAQRRGGGKQIPQEGDENRRPPRRRHDVVPTASGEGDKVNSRKDDQPFGNYGRPASDRNNRTERHRGGYRNMSGGGGYRGRNSGAHKMDGRNDRGKREFDRRSGSDRSGVRSTEKRDGAGPRNWGIAGKELEETSPSQVIPIVEDANEVETETQEKEVIKKDEEADQQEEMVVKEVEPSEMTLDEWKAKMEASQAKNTSLNIRKPGEGENVEQWKNMKLLHKSTRGENSAYSTNKEQHKRQTKPQVSMNIQFGDNTARGYGRGRPRNERGRDRAPRGGQQRYGGGDRSQRGQQLLPDVQNEQEFPTLG